MVARGVDSMKPESSDAFIVGQTNSDKHAAVESKLRAAEPDAKILTIANGETEVVPLLRVEPVSVVGRPTYLRDVVTLVRLMVRSEIEGDGRFIGRLQDHDSLLALVRAVSSLEQSFVLSLGRGIRRGEIRFYEGEITSAQVGVLHGIAALHQLSLWADARFDLRSEAIVRRQQIPVPREELARDVQAFLERANELAPRVSPALTYAADAAKVRALDEPLPDRVAEVLALFDGLRSMADVIEDSPFPEVPGRFAFHRRSLRVAHGAGHPRGAREAGTRPPTGLPDGELRGQRAGAFGSVAGDGARGCRDERDQFRWRSSTSGFTRTVWST